MRHATAVMEAALCPNGSSRLVQAASEVEDAYAAEALKRYKGAQNEKRSCRGVGSGTMGWCNANFSLWPVVVVPRSVCHTSLIVPYGR